MTGRRPQDPSSHIGFLDEVESKPKKKPRKETDEGLDLDRIW